MSRLPLCSDALASPVPQTRNGLLGLLLAFFAAAPVSAQQPPSPLELVRGLREQGMSDLALELLTDLEGKNLPPEQKAAIPLERAKAQLEAADEEPDEGARSAMIAEAKEGFTAFLRASGDHPRAPEASLALARLISIEAKAQLARAKRLDPPEGDDEGRAKQKEEAAKARPLFKVASNRFGEAAKKIELRLKDANLDNPTRRLIERDIYEADLSRGINQYSMADTYIRPTVQEKLERDKLLEEAQAIFAKLATGPNVVRTVWVARAWKAECDFERDKNADAEAEFKTILATQISAADDGKKMVRFFQLRRAFFQSVGNSAAMQTAASQARNWLSAYDSARRPTPESMATKFYLALNLQIQAEMSSPVPKGHKGPLPPVTGQSRFNMESAEKLYRVIAQSDNDYTTRAAKRRMQVVRRLLGEADRPPTDYKTFEESQMASLIQMAKLADAERDGANDADLKARRLKIVALLERARELITPKELKESAADVADALVRLIYFYQATDQPYQAAILGEHIARTMKIPGGKPAVAGMMGLNGYATAISTLPPGEGAAEARNEARKADRDRAIRLGRFLDEKYAGDTATDRARHRLAGLLMEEGKPVEAYDILLKVRPGYDGITGARLLQGAVASQLLSQADSPLQPERKKVVFRKTVAELEKTVKPEPTAEVDDIRGYVNTRCRVALLNLLQSRVDPEAEKAAPGFVKAQKIAEEVAGSIPSFAALVDEKTKVPTLDGMELILLAEDARGRAVYLWGRSLLDQGKGDEAFAAIAGLLTEMKNGRPYYTEEMKRWQSGAGMGTGGMTPEGGFFAEAFRAFAGDSEAAAERDAGKKARVATIADGVDKTRRTVIVLAVKARVKQGQVDQAAELLDLLKSYGGSVEANVPVLQQLSTELSAQIKAARNEGRADEAKALTDGFTKLLDKLSAEPNLPTQVQLFIGSSLTGVGEHGRAIETLKKVPDPGEAVLKAAADREKAEKLTPEQKQAVGLYRVAVLHTARALRGAKQYKQADDLLKRAIGTAKDPGWGSNSLDYRKEVAYLYEAQGADEADPKAATKMWGMGQQQWNQLFGVAQTRLKNVQNQFAKEKADPPPPGSKRLTEADVVAAKNGYYEAFFDVNRCVVKANVQILKGNPPKLQEQLTKTATRFQEIEKLGGTEISADVHNKYADLLAEVPELKKAYQAAGGKLFLERAAAQ
jgi:hypothetical protein